ncbi:hypothetical protein L226DRAFT_458011, partial [Lentinus tigrinus ALCF2SS1-7]|uniref:uncharacterized protein n=1 Tax=Lentinus tigrinus ALCF2SS1-7 TaxID=1328758 RepID=UPI001165DB46
HANNAVRAEMARREADKSLPKEERSDAAIRAWVKEAIELGGEAFWGRPNITPEEAKDQLQSPYVLKVMAYHLGAIQGSVWVPDGEEKALPEGALALAVCAVERAFEWYSKGQGRGKPQLSFSKDDHAGKDTAKWHVTAVDALLKKPHRFKRLLERARALVTVPAPPPLRTSANRAAGNGSVVNRRYIRERSSSPPAAV